ncbi:MAG: hypothetical protein ABSA14_01870 [Acidimicrobiales bacterium]|jgi:hypothetical protein
MPAVARGKSPAPARAMDLGKDAVLDSSYTYGGVEKSRDTSLFAVKVRTDSRMQVRRIPLAVRREPPSDVLEVVAQGTPHLSSTAQ